MQKQQQEDLYAKAGVSSFGAESALKGLLPHINKTLAFRPGTGKPLLDNGYFANVLHLTPELALAISTDGVGTKILIAEMMGKYDTIGIDCIAMNVNDVLCVGAEPISLVDYIAVERTDPDILSEIGKGLYAGAEQANINIPAGELAQLGEMIKGYGQESGFDLVGTCIGVIAPEKILVGQNVKPGNIIIGLRSSGVHSNGLTLARKALFETAGLSPETYMETLGRTIGQELLEPTRIYVKPVLDLLQRCSGINALVHITGDGFLNLTRITADSGFIITDLPEPQPIFSLIQESGSINKAEMFKVFNMGIGFCIITENDVAREALDVLREHGIEAMQIGHTVEDAERKVAIEPYGLVGKKNQFHNNP